ncbi:MAG: hypothetical protein WD648_04215 [Planctomycetaceae bacterium]
MAERKRSGLRTGVAWLVALIVLYVLSIGPAGWLWVHDYISDDTAARLISFYGPLYWLTDHSEVLDEAMNWYGRLWYPDDL